MKKTYIAPLAKAHAIKPAQMIALSVVKDKPASSSYGTTDDNSDVKEEDEDIWNLY